MNIISSQIIKEIKENNITAYNILYKVYWEKLYTFGLKISNGNTVLSEQIVQDIFVYIWEKRNKLNIDNLDSYLFQAVKFQFFSYYNKKKLDTVYLEEIFVDYITENLTSENPLHERLYKAIEKLPEKRKNILILNKIQGLNISQIAQQLDISQQTVKNQLSTALKQLKIELSDIPLILITLELYKIFN